MTLQSTPPIRDYFEDGATLALAIPFQFNDASEIQCTRIDNGVESAPLIGGGGDYSVSGGNGSTGTVTKTSGGTPGTIFRIRRITIEQQSTEFSGSGSIVTENLEKALDRAMAVAQEIDTSRALLEERAFRASSGEDLPALPAPPSRISKFMQWAADGKSVLLVGVSDLAQLLAAPIALLNGAASKGDPGGNAMAIGLFVFASTLSIPLGTDMVYTSGHSVKGLGFGPYKNDDVLVDAAYVAAHPKLAFISANGRGFVLAHDGTIDITQVGGQPGGVIDNHDAVAAAQSALFPNGGTLTAPKGVFRFSAFPDITSRINFKGTGVGQIGTPVAGITYAFPDDFDGTMLWFDAGVAGPRLLDNGLNAGDDSFPSASGSVWEKVAIRSASEGTAHAGIYGFESRTKVTLRDAEVRGFGDHGIYIRASLSGGDGVVYGNASKSRLDNVRSVNNMGDGCKLSGNDCNNVQLSNCHWQSNAGWGRTDDGFLPNTEINGTYEGNLAGRVRSTRQIGHTLVGCHAEEDGGTVDLDSSCMVLNGLLAQSPRLDPTKTPFMMSGSIATSAPYQHHNTKGPTHVWSQLGSRNTDMSAFMFGTDAGGGTEWAWQFDGVNRWRMVYAGAVATWLQPDGNNTQGRNYAPEFPRGAALGSGGGSAPNLIQYGGGFPSSGTFVLGDQLFFTAPAPSGKAAIVCTTGGTAGSTAVFKDWGVIDA